MTATENIIEVTDQSAVFPRPQSWMLHGVHGVPCDLGTS